MKKEQTIIKFDNIKDLLYHSVNTYADNIAFTTKIKNGKEVEYINHTYTNLLEDINCFGTSLYKLGLQGKRSAVVGHNCYEWAVAHLSNLLGGIVSVPLDKGLQIGELEDSLIRSEVEAIVFDEKLKDVIEEIKASGKTNIKHFICFSNKNTKFCEILYEISWLLHKFSVSLQAKYKKWARKSPFKQGNKRK